MDVRERLQTKLSYAQFYFRSVLWHDKFTRMTENLMYLNALGRPMIVINSLKAASELLDRRANISSDRPRQIVAHEIFCGGLFTVLMSYGDLLVFIFPLKFRDLHFCS